MLFNFVDTIDTFTAINVSNNAIYLVKNNDRFDVYRGKTKIYDNIYVSAESPFDNLFTADNVYFKSDTRVDVVRSEDFFKNAILGTAYFNINLKVSLREVSALSINDFELFALYMRNYNGSGPRPDGSSSLDSDSFGDSTNIDKYVSDTGIISFDLNPELKKLINTIKDKVDTETYKSHLDDENNPHKTSISNLKDVAIKDLKDKQIIIYDAVQNKYINADLSETTCTGEVKMDKDSDAKFLAQHIDGITIVKNETGFLCTKKILGQTVTITEINYLSGVKSNIQEQIDNLGKHMSMYGIFDTKELMLTCEKEKIDGSTAIVIKDESKDGKQMTYIYIADEKKWEPVAETTITVRDFTKEPIKLDSEITGILGVEHISDDIPRKSDLNDFLKQSNYDKDEDGIIDYAKALYNLSATVQELQDAVDKKHNHSNYSFLDGLTADNIGGLKFSDFNNSESILVSSVDSKIIFTLSKSINDKLSSISEKALQEDFGKHLEDNNNPHSVKLRQLSDIDIKGLEDEMGLIYNLATDKFTFAKIKSDGKVKLDAAGTSKYLSEHIDLSSIIIKNSKLVAKALDGQLVTIAELNHLKGAKLNIQEQIDNLSGAMSMYGVFDTKIELLSCTDEKHDGSTAIVIKDETNDNKQMTYIYLDKSNKWEVVAETSIAIRNFTTNPIKLENEVTGILDESHVSEDIARKSALDGLMSKETYASSTNEGSVKKADTLYNLSVSIKDINDTVEAFDNEGDGSRLLGDDGEYHNYIYKSENPPQDTSVFWLDINDSTKIILKVFVNNIGWTNISSIDGTKIQYEELPEANSDSFGMIVQYTGETTIEYTRGCFYECIKNNTRIGYKWNKILSGSSGGDGDSSIYIGIDEPEDKGLVWFDIIDIENPLIKLYDRVNDEWRILNNSISSKFIKSIIGLKEDKLVVINSDNTNTEIDLSSLEIDYNLAVNKPTINLVEVDGHLTGNDLGLMDKEVYASKKTEGSVIHSDSSKELDGIITAEALTYYGRDKYGNKGFHAFPISPKDIQNNKFVIENPVANETYSAQLAVRDPDCGSVIQAYEFVMDESEVLNVDGSLFSFRSAKDYNYNPEHVEISDGVCDIKKSHELEGYIFDEKYFKFDLKNMLKEIKKIEAISIKEEV